MKTVKIPVKDTSVGELIDSVMAGGEYYIVDDALKINSSGHISTESEMGYGVNAANLSLTFIERCLDDRLIYQLKPSEDYVAELLNNWMDTQPYYSRLDGSKMIVKFLESEGFLTLPEGEV